MKCIFYPDGPSSSERTSDPGSMWYITAHKPDECKHWDDCDGKHLIVVLPDGDHLDIDRRASNCTTPNDRMHRCWKKTGEPENLTVYPSLVGKTWHGYLGNGELTSA